MHIRALATAAGVLALVPCISKAQEIEKSFPTRPLRIIVGFGPGTAMDTISRLVAQQLNGSWQQSVVVENREGAGGSIGTAAAANAQPDGYTMHIVPPSFVVGPFLGPLPYDPVKDFAPVSLVATVPLVLVANMKVPARSVSELIAHAKANPGKLQFASSGRGSTSSLVGHLFASMANVHMTDVPYKSTSQAFGDVVGDRVAMYFPSLAPAMPFIQSGRLRPLGMTTAKRASSLPQVPAIAETLPGFDVSLWYGFVVPVKTPGPVIDKLNKELVRIVNLPEIKAKLVALGLDVQGSNPTEFSQLWAVEQKRWVSLLKDNSVRIQ